MLQWGAESGTSNSPKAHRGVEPGPDNFIWLETRTAPQRNTFVYQWWRILWLSHTCICQEEGYVTERKWPIIESSWLFGKGHAFISDGAYVQGELYCLVKIKDRKLPNVVTTLKAVDEDVSNATIWGNANFYRYFLHTRCSHVHWEKSNVTIMYHRGQFKEMI